MNPQQKFQKLVAILIILNLICLVLSTSLNIYQTMTIHAYNSKVVELESDIGSQNKIIIDLNSSSTRIEGQLKFVIGHLFKVDGAK